MSRRIVLLSIFAAALCVGSVMAFGGVCAAAVQPAGDAALVPERVLGNANAPIVVEEYVSLTCPHCGEFVLKTLPELEKKYVDSGKVKFILRDYPLDGTALKAAVLARCMPDDMFYPFVKTLYSGLTQWATSTNPEKILIQYAKLGGLSEDKAKACLQDQAMQDAVIAERTQAADKFNIEATPTFIVNYGAVKLEGDKTVAEFSAVFDKLLTKAK